MRADSALYGADVAIAHSSVAFYYLKTSFNRDILYYILEAAPCLARRGWDLTDRAQFTRYDTANIERFLWRLRA